MHWIRITEYNKAPEDVTVWTKIQGENGDRMVQKLKFSDNLWWFPDKSMYIYYTPTHFAFVGE